ncbi:MULTISPECIES: LysR family transcriptional regulator [unclassified Actinopolyspora]|uniref:LysR family transcriptional regulator n=1 Tax=Actinopolyspora TaxID=1849 RepID=UPI0013F680EA|nr:MULTISPECIES: LysR family transcriptional regulator [unclassified Actinopolyspora]NHD16127.1 LysR family transcriptional regulator [Actinopolyspora sp. BKK2]NHE74659.1 LysR family transcriptional regulator [Actinopolyspora sp. BKK1]
MLEIDTIDKKAVHNLDLNLLVSLHHLLRERSVTQAAQRMSLGQPALSAALGRLRRHFGDQLLTRVGNHYELTPLAARLRPRTEAALAGVERVFTSEPVFDPATSQATFRVLASDYAMSLLGGRVGRLLTERAPNMRLRFELHNPSVIDAADEVLRDVDALLLPHGFLTDLPNLDVFSDTWSCLVAADNPHVGDELTMGHLAELPWVLTYHSPSAFTPAARQLQMLGIEPDVQVVVESFLALPSFVAGTNRIALTQTKLAPLLTAGGEVRALPCPYDAVPLVEALWWHPTHDNSPEHTWLRSIFAEAGQQLAEASA